MHFSLKIPIEILTLCFLLQSPCCGTSAEKLLLSTSGTIFLKSGKKKKKEDEINRKEANFPYYNWPVPCHFQYQELCDI